MGFLVYTIFTNFICLNPGLANWPEEHAPSLNQVAKITVAVAGSGVTLRLIHFAPSSSLVNTECYEKIRFGQRFQQPLLKRLPFSPARDTKEASREHKDPASLLTDDRHALEEEA